MIRFIEIKETRMNINHILSYEACDHKDDNITIHYISIITPNDKYLYRFETTAEQKSMMAYLDFMCNVNNNNDVINVEVKR